MNRWTYRFIEAILSGRLPDPRTTRGVLWYGGWGLLAGLVIGTILH